MTRAGYLRLNRSRRRRLSPKQAYLLKWSQKQNVSASFCPELCQLSGDGAGLMWRRSCAFVVRGQPFYEWTPKNIGRHSDALMKTVGVFIILYLNLWPRSTN